jgi:hypothetical protein
MSTRLTTICEYGVCAPTWVANARPMMATVVPMIMTAFSGRRRSSTRLVNCEARNTAAGIGTKATPARSGL